MDEITFQMGVNVHPLIERGLFRDLVKKGNSLSENNFLERKRKMLFFTYGIEILMC